MGDYNPKNDFGNFIFTDLVSTLKEKISSSRFPPPRYNSVSHKIEFAGVDIQIPYNSDQDMVCKIIFKNTKAMCKEWCWDEVVEKWGENIGLENYWRTVYNAGREINNKVATETTIKDLLLVRKLTIAVNPKYAGG